ncbi:MAG TPA: tetratricopeptide repeat protein, partial [Acetobacteraceae bacterium]|nr:tetratricopeptide repeat protein [Acetobacteraceae bacterium]
MAIIAMLEWPMFLPQTLPSDLMQSGGAAYARGDFAAAAAAFEAVLAVDAANTTARVNLASVLWSQGALDAARARAEEAVAEIPALAEAWVILGAIQLDS